MPLKLPPISIYYSPSIVTHRFSIKTILNLSLSSLGFSNEYLFRYTKINSALPTYILCQRLNSSRRLRATCIVHLTCLLSFPSVDKCADCDTNADCVNGKCRCKMGYVGTGYACVKGNLAATN